MEISIKTGPGQKTVKIKGSVNALDMPKLQQALSDTDRLSSIVLDLTETDFICTGFINLLVELKGRAPGDHEKIRLLNPNNLVLELLEITGITKIVRIEAYHDELKNEA